MMRGLSWPGAWQGEVSGIEVAVGDVDEVADPLPAPNAADLADAGRRGGETLRLYLRRRALLRVLVAQRLGLAADAVVVGYDARGAPVLRQRRLPRTRNRPQAPRLFVSLSARGGLAAFALAEGPVGIDLEPLADPGPLAAALTLAEGAALAAAPEEVRPVMALRYWTAKEAYLKALGMGLLRDPARIEITAADGFTVRDGGRSHAEPREAAGQGHWLGPAVRGGPIVVAVFRRNG
jgi:4'-phosphopantetheinyl transferase